jgi:hypothetical protein
LEREYFNFISRIVKSRICNFQIKTPKEREEYHTRSEEMPNLTELLNNKKIEEQNRKQAELEERMAQDKKIKAFLTQPGLYF